MSTSTSTKLTDPMIHLVANRGQSLNVHPPAAPPMPVVSGPIKNPLNVFTLLYCLRRRWSKTVSIGTILAATVAAVIFLFLPPSKPFATTKVYFPPRAALLGGEPVEPAVNPRTQKEIILSRTILKSVVERPEVAQLPTIQEKPDPVYWLSKEIGIDFPSESEILKISLYGDRGEDLHTIVNVIREVYKKEVNTRSTGNRTDRVAKLKDNHARSEERLKEMAKEYQAVTDVAGGSDPQLLAFKAQNTEKNIELIQDQLVKIGDEVAVLKRQERSLKPRNAQGVPLVGNEPPEPILPEADPEEMAELQKEKKETERLLFLKKQALAADHPDILELRQRVAELQKRIGMYRPVSTVSTSSGPRPTTLTEVQEQLKRLERDEQTLTHRLNERKKQAEDFKNATIALEKSRGKLREAENTYASLTAALDKLQFETDAAARVQDMDETIVTRPNDAARRIRLSVLGAVGSFGLVVLIMGFIEFRAGRIDTPEQIRGLGFGLIGTVPRKPISKTTQGQHEEINYAWENLVSESIDSARTILLHQVEKVGSSVVLVTSATNNEGKSSVSFRLARSLARAGKRTLLLDGDLRSPSLHQFMEKPLIPGICESLRESMDLCSLIHPTPQKDLWFMTAGKCDPTALDLLAQGGFSQMITALRSMFEVILIDSSPLLPVADGMLMANSSDAVLFSVMCDVSRMDLIDQARERLAAIGISPIGAIVNGTRAEAYGAEMHGPITTDTR